MAEARRLKLHEELIKILGSSNVKFQPPESVKLSYPCIRYFKSNVDAKRANNSVYMTTDRYEIIVIGLDPDNDIADRILRHFPMCSYDRRYVKDNLYHDVLTLYY